MLRAARGLTVRELARRLEVLGRPILPSGITKIENGGRRVDTGDLVALALALEVNPNRLLLPVDKPADDFALAPEVVVRPFEAWSWANGEQVLFAGKIALGMDDQRYGEGQDDFRRHSLPVDERLREDHTAVRAARDVLDGIRALLHRIENPDDYPPESKASEWRGGGPNHVEYLRLALSRLTAEVEALAATDIPEPTDPIRPDERLSEWRARRGKAAPDAS